MAVTCGLIPDAPPQGQGWDQPAQRGTDPAAWGGGWAAACSADICNALAVPCKARRYTDTHDEVARALGKHQVHPDTGGNSRQVLKKSPVTPTVLLG